MPIFSLFINDYYSVQEKMFFEGIAIDAKFIRIMFSRREWMSFGFNEILKVSNITCQILMIEYAKYMQKLITESGPSTFSKQTKQK